MESQLLRATLVKEVELILFIIKHCQTPLTCLSVTVSGNKIGQDPVRGRGGHTLIIYALITAALAAEELAGAWLLAAISDISGQWRAPAGHGPQSSAYLIPEQHRLGRLTQPHSPGDTQHQCCRPSIGFTISFHNHREGPY